MRMRVTQAAIVHGQLGIDRILVEIKARDCTFVQVAVIVMLSF